MDKQRIEGILNNAPNWSDEVKVKNGRVTTLYGNSGEVDYQNHSLADLQTQLDQLNEIERLKSVIKTYDKFYENAMEGFEGCMNEHDLNLHFGITPEYSVNLIEAHEEIGELNK